MDPRKQDDLDRTGTLPLQGGLSQAAEPATGAEETPAWVAEAREGLTTAGKYLAFEDGDSRQVVPIEREWTRIGRSLAADVRFDDATVSRRHALIVQQADGTRVLDDRSLNGVYVNGRRVEWSPLTDGDQVAIGRHTLHYLDTTKVEGGASGAPVSSSAE